MENTFGWSTQYAADPYLPNQRSDDGLPQGACFHDALLHSSDQHVGSLQYMSSSQTIPNLVHCHDGASLSGSVPAAFMGTAGMLLPRATGAVDGGNGLFDAFASVPGNLVDGLSQATVSNSNTVFSGYSSTTGGNGNISSGESNTCGGGVQDMEVVSRPTLLQTPTHPPSKRQVDKYPASSSSATAECRCVKRSAASASASTNVTFVGQSHVQASRTMPLGAYDPVDAEATARVKEMIYRAAAMRPVHQLVSAAAPASSQQQRRKNVRISSDPQTVAARLRRERVSERLRVLQRLVPGGSRMDTASMLDEAASYLKFLKSQLTALERAGNPSHGGGYCNDGGSNLVQNYYIGNLGGGGGTSGSGSSNSVLAFGSRDGIGGYVNSNRTMSL